MILTRYFVYIITNFKTTVFYIGVTNNLQRRIFEHKNKLVKGFSNKYKLTRLLYFEEFKNVEEAISKEKQLKNWHRQWKINLIKEKNPKLEDLSGKW